MEPAAVFVTSLNKELFDSYGKRMIESWLHYAPMDGVLVVCHEEDNAPYLNSVTRKNVVPMSLKYESLERFKNIFGQFSEANGLIREKTNQPEGTVVTYYNYRFDALRFSFKIFSLMKTLRVGLLGQRFAWIDADTVCLKPFTAQDLDELFPDHDQIASYLGRENYPKPNPYSECGFVGYNGTLEATTSFLRAIEDLYTTGHLFLLPEWHDCMAFDFVRQTFSSNGSKFKNLSEHCPNSSHPFIESPLAQYFDHLKGPARKRAGSSLPSHA